MSDTNEYPQRSAVWEIRRALDERIALIQTAIDGLVAVQKGVPIQPIDGWPGTPQPEAFQDVFSWADHCINAGLPGRNELQKLRARL